MKQGRELIHRIAKQDLIVQPFKASGPGGQHKNKNATAIRIIHPESGARAECKEHKSQLQNKKTALKRLVETKEFNLWHRLKVSEIQHGRDSLEKMLEEMMRPENLKIEVFDAKQGKYVLLE